MATRSQNGQINSNGLKSLVEAYSDSDSEYEEVNGERNKTEAPEDDSNVLLTDASPEVPAEPPIKKFKKFPLPENIKGMFSDQQNSSLNENKADEHGGRVRTFGHVRGNWASFVYLPFTIKQEAISMCVEILQNNLNESPDQSHIININDEFHLSLSKTVVLHHHWIDPFIHSLKKSIRIRKRFNVVFTEFEVYVNEEKTRTFIGMNVFPSEFLYDLIHDCDKCLNEYGLERYYKNASFHVSIGWCIGNQEKWMKSHLLPILNTKWSQVLDGNPTLQISRVKTVELKTGNKVYQFLLDEAT